MKDSEYQDLSPTLYCTIHHDSTPSQRSFATLSALRLEVRSDSWTFYLPFATGKASGIRRPVPRTKRFLRITITVPAMSTPSTEHVFNALPIAASADSQYHRSYFYVGGEYVDAGSGDGQRIFTGQMYVEQLTPADGDRHPWPIVFIQGAGQTGTVS